MRLWSLHPQYLDAKGLIAVWREGLLAQAVLEGKTRGYKNHPQLARFTGTGASESYIAAYLHAIFTESSKRGYCFNEEKIGQSASTGLLQVTEGQLRYEWSHLKGKLEVRAPAWLSQLEGVGVPEPHPQFQSVPGPVAEWEVVTAQRRG